MKTMTRTELAALKKLDTDKFRDVSAAMVAILAGKGLCTVMGNITDAGRKALPWKRTSYARSAQLHQMTLRDDVRRVARGSK